MFDFVKNISEILRLTRKAWKIDSVEFRYYNLESDIKSLEIILQVRTII